MNTLKGTIIGIKSSSEMSMVDLDFCGDIFTALVLEIPDTAIYLRKGNLVDIIFKETEVSIAKNLSGLISIRNRFKATVKLIKKYELLTTLVLNYKKIEITSIISSLSQERLDLKEGDHIEWLVKTNEVSLCPLK